MKRRAFTLIEMLVVLAITSVLLAIILIPIVQSFNFTRSAQGFADAQEKGRRLIESIQREIAQAASVRDNDGDRGATAIVVPGQNGALVTVLMPYTKLDIYKPAQGDPSNVRGGAYVDENGVADPTLQAPTGQVVLPVAPGMTIVRYFIGLNRPLAANNLDPARYTEPYSGLLMNRSGDRDNLYVLYRAEVQPIVFRNGQFEVNTALFADADNDGVPDDLDDPYFFVQDAPGLPVLPPAERTAKAQRIFNWRNAATVVTEFSRYDMIQPVFNRATRQVVYSNNVPQLASLIQFKPTGITREPARGQVAVRIGEETDNAHAIAPDVFSTDFGNWSSAIVRLFPVNYNPAPSIAENFYLVARFDNRAGTRRLRVYRYDPDLDPDGDDRNGEDDPTDDMEIFDIGAYEQWTSRGLAFPFTRAMMAANGRSGWIADATARDSFVPFYVDQLSGKIYTGFGINEVGVDDPTGSTLPPANDNLPAKDAGPYVTPTSDPVTPGNFYDAGYANINRLFTKVWNDHPELQGPAVHRFIDLRVTPNADGTLSPLHPTTSSVNGLPQAQIVPGSEVVIGPDQNPGPNFGNAVRYSRVTANPGRNQYRLNYTNQVEPNYTLLGLANPPATYDPQDFMSAVYQPRYKVGYLQLNSDQDDAIPAGQVSVFYKFQFVKPRDSITVDYDSREMISILLTIKNFPQSTLPNPQLITLKATAPVRNYVR